MIIDPADVASRPESQSAVEESFATPSLGFDSNAIKSTPIVDSPSFASDALNGGDYDAVLERQAKTVGVIVAPAVRSDSVAIISML